MHIYIRIHFAKYIYRDAPNSAWGRSRCLTTKSGDYYCMLVNEWALLRSQGVEAGSGFGFSLEVSLDRNGDKLTV